MARKKYNIEQCITLHDVKQIQKEPPQAKIKTKNQLVKKLVKDKTLKGTKSSLYSKISRYESEGFKNEDTDLTKALLKILEVTREELIS